MNKKVVLILGTGHCGSTLLDLVLGSNSRISSLGELNQLRPEVQSDNSFWNSNLLNRLQPYYRYRTNRIISFDYHRIPSSRLFENRETLYLELMKESGSEVLVDSAKTIAWIKRSFFHLFKSKEIEPIIILMERSPLAVVNSYYRKYKAENSLESIALDIKSRVSQNRKFFGSLDEVKIKKMIVSYEKFCKNPEKVSREICDLIKVPFEEGMLRYWEYEHFNISGNSGTNSLIKKYKNQDIKINKKRGDLDHYESHPLKIALDERWQKELNEEEIRKIKGIIPESYFV